MVVLGVVRFLMSEVSLYTAAVLVATKALSFAEFSARQRVSGLTGHELRGPHVVGSGPTMLWGIVGSGPTMLWVAVGSGPAIAWGAALFATMHRPAVGSREKAFSNGQGTPARRTTKRILKPRAVPLGTALDLREIASQ